MKKALIISIYLCFAIAIMAQPSKPERRVYIWDVSLSMKGKLTLKDGTKSPNIYNKVRDLICTDIGNITNENTEIIVLPFCDKILTTFEHERTASKEVIINKIKAFNFDDAKARTNICGPIIEVTEKYLDNDKTVIIHLLTDGYQEVEGYMPINHYLGEWKEKSNKDDRFYYWMLTKEANIKGLDNLPEGGGEVELIPPETDINALQNFSNIELIPQNLKQHNIKENDNQITLTVHSTAGLPDNIKIQIDCDNTYFEIKETATLHNNEIKFYLKYKLSESDLHLNLPESSFYNVSLKLINADELKAQTRGSHFKLRSNYFKLELINKAEKILKISLK